MSEDVKKPSEPLFSKKNKKLVTDPLTDNNPITIQVLGICSALAITVQVEQGVVMSAAVLFVLIFGNVIISLWRSWESNTEKTVRKKKTIKLLKLK